MVDAPGPPRWWSDRLERALLALAVAVGAVLSVLTALNQPYNQNEWVQLEPYDSWDPAVVTSGTRQPPLDPILGALVQHALGTGQLQQRVIPVLAGVGSLVVMALLLRRFRIHVHGTLALWFLATAPLFLRYNGYTRPYALPMFLILLCAYAGSRWLDDGETGGRRRWLVVALGAALLLPLARVPEPVVFLGSSMLILLLAGWRRWLPRGRAWALAGGLLLALGSVGALTTLKLGSAESAGGSSLIDLDLGRAIDRVPAGLRELRDFVAPSYAAWFPWWPITLAVVVLALVLPWSRRALVRTWWWLPLLLGPLVFLAAYHSLNPFPLDQRHYRMRFAYFVVPPVTVLVALASAALSHHLRAWVGPLVAAALLVSQLQTTYSVLTDNDTNDVAAAARVIETRVPDDAVLVYDGPSPEGHWRQPFFGSERFFTDDTHARIVRPFALAANPDAPVVGDRAGPTWLLILDAPCVDSVACDSPDIEVGPIAGWEAVERFDHYTLYEPAEGQAGREGFVAAMDALAAAYGEDAGALNSRLADSLR